MAQQTQIGAHTETNSRITRFDDGFVHVNCRSKPASVSARINHQRRRSRSWKRLPQVQIEQAVMERDPTDLEDNPLTGCLRPVTCLKVEGHPNHHAKKSQL